MHRLLERQIKRALNLDSGSWPSLNSRLHEWLTQAGNEDAGLAAALYGLPTLFERISEAYAQQERDLALLRRSLELSSTELSSANNRLRDEAHSTALALAALQRAFDALRSDASMPGRDDLVGIAEQVAALTRDQQRMRLALSKSEERFDLAMRGSSDGLWDWDIAAGTVYYSPRWKAMIGQGEDEVGNSLDEWSRRVHPDDLAAAEAALQEHLQGRRDHFEVSFRFLHRDGHHLWILSRGQAVRDAQGRAVRMVGTHTDISPRMALEHHLAQFKHAIDEHAIVSITDVHGNITFANRKFAEISGYGEQELLGKNHRLLKSGLHPDSFYAEMWRTISSGRTWIGEISNRAKDGHIYWMLATIAPMLDENGLPSQYIAIRADISKNKQTEAELIKAKEEAVAANHLKSEFLANMSHEIRTPMNGVIGMLGLALDTPLNEEQREYVGLARTSADNLLHILNDILDLSKIEAGRLDIHAEDTNLHELIAELDQLTQPRCLEKQLTYESHLDPALPRPIRADPMRLRQVLQNLLSNAVKFTHQGSIRLAVRRQQDQLHFSVEDTGIGIPYDKQASVFEAFTQADGSITKRFGGTGLGLTISNRLVQMMGGHMGLNSLPGHGSCFYFTLPITDAKPGGLADAPNPPATGGLDILLADDNPISRKLTMALLARAGHRLRVAESEAALIGLLTTGPCDLLLLDMQMPGMDGMAAARRIRTEANTGRRLPIIALSSQPLDRQQCQAAHIDGFVAKPIRRDELLAAIASLPSAG
jgi:PAS domain S-box-containing protein